MCRQRDAVLAALSHHPLSRTNLKSKYENRVKQWRLVILSRVHIRRKPTLPSLRLFKGKPTWEIVFGFPSSQEPLLFAETSPLIILTRSKLSNSQPPVSAGLSNDKSLLQHVRESSASDRFWATSSHT